MAAARHFWRFSPLVYFAYALLLLPLPWINVRCCQEFSDGSWRETDVSASQTGLESLTGSYHGKASYDFDLRRFPPWWKRHEQRVELDPPPRPAPLVTAHAAVLFLGLLGGLFLRRAPARLAGVGTCALAAFAVLALQAVRGFPAAELIADHNRRALREWRLDRERPPSWAAGASYRSGGPIAVGPCLVELRYTPWFYLSLALPLAAYATVLLEWLVHRAPPDVRGQVIDSWGLAAPDDLLSTTAAPDRAI